jgi:hypothetical protein
MTRTEYRIQDGKRRRQNRADAGYNNWFRVPSSWDTWASPQERALVRLETLQRARPALRDNPRFLDLRGRLEARVGFAYACDEDDAPRGRGLDEDTRAERQQMGIT